MICFHCPNRKGEVLGKQTFNRLGKTVRRRSNGKTRQTKKETEQRNPSEARKVARREAALLLYTID